jgi:hypothetical protein
MIWRLSYGCQCWSDLQAHLTAQSIDILGLDCMPGRQTLRYMRQHTDHLIRLRSNEQDRNFQILQTLWVRNPLASDKSIEPLLRQPRQFSVGLANKASFGNC